MLVSLKVKDPFSFLSYMIHVMPMFYIMMLNVMLRECSLSHFVCLSGAYVEDYIVVDTVVVPPEGSGDLASPRCLPPQLHSSSAGMRSLFTEGLVYLPHTYQANSYFLQHGSSPPTSAAYVRGHVKRCVHIDHECMRAAY